MPAKSSPKRILILYLLSAIFGTIGGLLTIAVIFVIDELIDLVWSKGFGINPDAPIRTIAVVVVLIICGLVVGLLNKKYGKTGGGIEVLIRESLDKGHIEWRKVPKDLLISTFSIASGASLGPEAPASILAAGVASYTAEKTNMGLATSRAINLSAIAGMFGSLLSNPFLATVMFIETSKDHIKKLQEMIGYSMIAGAFGMATFFVLFNKLYVFDLGIPAYTGPTATDLYKAFVFGIIGAIFAIVVGIIMHKAEPIFKKLDRKVITRSLIGAVIAGLIAYAAPLTMFSGQNVLPDVITTAATTSFIALMLLAFAKLIATSVLLRTGFFGGIIFPSIFAGGVLGLAFNHFLHAPVALAISCTIAGLITLAMRQPLTAAFLTLAIAGTSIAAPTALAVSAGLIMLVIVKNKLSATQA